MAAAPPLAAGLRPAMAAAQAPVVAAAWGVGARRGAALSSSARCRALRLSRGGGGGRDGWVPPPVVGRMPPRTLSVRCAASNGRVRSSFGLHFVLFFLGGGGGGSVLIHPYAREILVMTIKYVSLDPYTIPYSYCTPHIVLGRSSAPPSRVSHSIPFTFLYLIIIPFG